MTIENCTSNNGKNDEKKLDNSIYERDLTKLRNTQNSWNGSVLWSMIWQFRKGVDFSKLQSPPFLLKPISVLESLANSHNLTDTLVNSISDEKSTKESRFLSVLQFHFEGCYSNTKCNKINMSKPYNPILGELFHCKRNHKEKTESVYIAEQVSHHPPISCFFIENKKKKLVYTSTIKHGGSFSGNSIYITTDGNCVLYNFNHNEKYFIKPAGCKLNGIIYGTSSVSTFGKMEIKCEDIHCTVKFNEGSVVTGEIIKGDEKLFSISGNLKKKIWIKENKKKGEKILLTNLENINVMASFESKIIKDVNSQAENESRRVWHQVTENIINADMDQAGIEKQKVENEQREKRKNGVKVKLTYFKELDDGTYQFQDFHPKNYK